MNPPIPNPQSQTPNPNPQILTPSRQVHGIATFHYREQSILLLIFWDQSPTPSKLVKPGGLPRPFSLPLRPLVVALVGEVRWLQEFFAQHDDDDEDVFS